MLRAIPITQDQASGGKKNLSSTACITRATNCHRMTLAGAGGVLLLSLIGIILLELSKRNPSKNPETNERHTGLQDVAVFIFALTLLILTGVALAQTINYWKSIANQRKNTGDSENANIENRAMEKRDAKIELIPIDQSTSALNEQKNDFSLMTSLRRGVGTLYDKAKTSITVLRNNNKEKTYLLENKKQKRYTTKT